MICLRITDQPDTSQHELILPSTLFYLISAAYGKRKECLRDYGSNILVRLHFHISILEIILPRLLFTGLSFLLLLYFSFFFFFFKATDIRPEAYSEPCQTSKM